MYAAKVKKNFFIKLIFLKDFFADCTFSLSNDSSRACPEHIISSWSKNDYYTHFTTLPIFIGIYVNFV
jgi:hypothetical protein